ncbi:LOW QUALITY PROTEIN: hypothetical protein Cgig2_013801 [Carnegiea gigantea]|uniref:Uncharacterized protein n=1 Tax=Carnegiea gigantea TaxID=171969 RepID=A0A9Q1K418_9CARY|nr:LOW QUALITY PROTEIN: hypothetical protein Cgig2_013801 [Carnegiea gigantea]
MKHWGLYNLTKLGNLLGIPSKIDKQTRWKLMLNYARLLIEMRLDVHQLTLSMRMILSLSRRSTISGNPVKCSHCHVFRHEESECRKKNAIKKEYWNNTKLEHHYKQCFSYTFGEVHNPTGGTRASWACALLEAKVKKCNQSNVIRRICGGWHVATNFRTHPNGKIMVTWMPYNYDIDILMKNKLYIVRLFKSLHKRDALHILCVWFQPEGLKEGLIREE